MTHTQHSVGKTKPQAPVRAADIVREYGPFAGTAFDTTYLYQIAEARIDKIDPETGGAVLERLEMRRGTGVGGPESDGADLFYCGGGSSGKVRVVRKPNP